MPLREPFYAVVRHSHKLAARLIIAIIVLLWFIFGLPLVVPVMLFVAALTLVVYWTRVVANHVTKRTTSTLLSPEECVLLRKVGRSAIIHCIIYLNSPMDLDRLRDKVKREILNKNCSNGVLNNFTRRLIMEQFPLWHDVENIDIYTHVQQITTNFTSEMEINNYIAKSSCEGLDISKPLWEIRSCYFKQEGFLLVRLHPCLISGKGAVSILCTRLADTACSYTSPHRFPSDQLWKRARLALFTFPLYLIQLCKDHKKQRRMDDQYFSQKTDFYTICKGRRRHACSGKLHLPSFLHTAAVMRTSLSAICISALASSVRLIPNDIIECGSFPVKVLYDLNNTSGSHFFSTSYRESIIDAPCRIEGAIPCLWRLRQTMTSLKQNFYPYFNLLIFKLLKIYSPYALSLKYLSSLTEQRALCAFTSLSGPTATLYICGTRVQRINMWYPLTDDVIITSSMMTYADECRISVEAWENSGIDPNAVADECKRQIEILIDLVKNRPIPKRKKLYYDDCDLDELDLNFEDEAVDNAHVQQNISTTLAFFQRSYLHHSSSNGIEGNDATIATISHEVEAHSNMKDRASPSANREFDVNTANTAPNVMTSDLDVGIEISPVVERKNSVSLL